MLGGVPGVEDTRRCVGTSGLHGAERGGSGDLELVSNRCGGRTEVRRYLGSTRNGVRGLR